MGGRQDAYEVIGLARNGREEVVARYPGN